MFPIVHEQRRPGAGKKNGVVLAGTDYLALTGGGGPWADRLKRAHQTALLQAMTSNAARLMGVDRERGAIRAGQAADIIATAENPLDNAAALKHVVFVMKNGRVVKGG